MGFALAGYLFELSVTVYFPAARMRGPLSRRT